MLPLCAYASLPPPSPPLSQLTAAVLRCLSDPEPEIVAEAAQTNTDLMALVRATPVGSAGFEPALLIATVTREVPIGDKTTRT